MSNKYSGFVSYSFGKGFLERKPGRGEERPNALIPNKLILLAYDNRVQPV